MKTDERVNCMTHGAFSKEILADLMAEGVPGSELAERAEEMREAIRSAAAALMAEADRIAAGEAPYATLDDVFGELD